MATCTRSEAYLQGERTDCDKLRSSPGSESGCATVSRFSPFRHLEDVLVSADDESRMSLHMHLLPVPRPVGPNGESAKSRKRHRAAQARNPNVPDQDLTRPR